MKKIFPAFTVLTLFALSCTPPGSITREEAIAAIKAFDDAWKNKNQGSVDSVLSSSYIYFTQSGGIFERKNILVTAGSSDYKLQTAERQVFDIKIEGTTAIVNTIWSGKGTYFGDPFDDTQRCSITLIKRNGKVELLSEHCTVVK